MFAAEFESLGCHVPWDAVPAWVSGIDPMRRVLAALGTTLEIPYSDVLTHEIVEDLESNTLDEVWHSQRSS